MDLPSEGANAQETSPEDVCVAAASRRHSPLVLIHPIHPIVPPPDTFPLIGSGQIEITFSNAISGAHGIQHHDLRPDDLLTLAS